MMEITRRSRLSGIVRTRDIPITVAELHRWEHGGMIQQVAPHLSASDCEFILTGITDNEWDDTFGGMDD
jgi:hypothetical protein